MKPHRIERDQRGHDCRDHGQAHDYSRITEASGVLRCWACGAPLGGNGK